LLERYQEAIARSRKIGHRVSFRVEVDPTAGAPTITPVEEQPLASMMGFPSGTRLRPTLNLRQRSPGRVSVVADVSPKLSRATIC